jgi:hypothetical protein
MEHAAFWAIVDAARGARDQAGEIQRVLEGMPGEDIAAFDGWLFAYRRALDREDLWCAVSAIRGGCGDDAFDYFRAWLIGRGEAAVLAAVRDPESLADLIADGDYRNEAMIGVATRAYAAAVGGPLPGNAAMPAIPDRAAWPADRLPRGAKWTDALVAASFPALHARFVAPRARVVPGIDGAGISHARFWAIVEAARSAAGGSGVRAVAAQLVHVLAAGPHAEIVGAHRWLGTYNEALIRNDVRAACRAQLGSAELMACFGYRGWLIAQGEAVVRAALAGSLDAVGELARDRVEPCDAVIGAAEDAGARVKLAVYLGVRADETIPFAAEIRPDWPEAPPFAPALLRERLPRLAAGLREEAAGRRPRPRRAPPRPPPAPAGPPGPVVGARVRHATFGDGVVVSVEGAPPKVIVVVDFAGGRKKLLGSAVELVG